MAPDLKEATRRFLLSRIRAVMIGVGVVAGLLVASTWLIDEGEIVKITTRDAQGYEHDTELWVVDLPSGTYLRSSRGDTRWLARLREDPQVVLERDEAVRHCAAVPREGRALAAKVDRAMAEKYGFVDSLWGALSDRSGSVPVELRSCDAPVATP